VAEGLGATGDGSVDLAEQTIDYDAVVDMTALPLIPFKISGPLADPSYSLDTSQFLKYAAEGIVKTPLRLGKGAVEGGADAVESIGEGVGETLKKGLGGLFDGGGDKKQE
jgi:hypothetical protein